MTERRFRYAKLKASKIREGAEVRMADGEWATIARVEPLKHEIRWRMERDGRLLAYVEVWAGGHHNTRRPWRP